MTLPSHNRKSLPRADEATAATEEKGESRHEVLLTLNEQMHEKNLALTEAKRVMDAFFEQSLLLLFIIDLETGKLSRVNDAVVKATGIGEAALLDMSFIDVFDSEMPKTGATHLAALKNGTVIHGQQTRFLGKAGEIVLEWSATPDPEKQLAYAFARDITEQCRTESELKESETRLHTAAENLNGILWVIDKDLRFVVSKGHGLNALGLDSGELEGKFMSDFMSENDPAIARTHRALQGETLHFETARGETAFSSVVSPIRDHRGEINGVVGVALDISKRKQIEEALKESEARLRSITDNALDFIFIKDKQRRYTFVNRAMQQLIGLPLDHILGKTPQEIFGPAQGDLISVLDDRCFAGESINETESLTIQGQRRYFNTIQHPLSITDGEVQSIMGIVRDVTELKLTEAKLKESEARFRSYIAHSPDGIFVADEHGICVDVNDAGTQLTGYAKEELIGKSMMWIVYEEDMPLAEDLQRRLVSHGQGSAEIRCVRKDARVSVWIIDAVRLSDKHILGFVKDITAYKQMADELRHAEKMQAVGELAGGIAHDFNNQLSGILGYAEFLREEAGHNAILTRYADNIITGVKRASDLTAQMLAFSRKGKYLNVTVDMHRIVFEVVNLLKHSIHKKVMIEQELRATPSTTQGDPTQLQAAILNLALNARDAMPDGGRLCLTTETVRLDESACDRMPFALQPGPYLKLSVADTGMGIPDEVKPRIFEPFFTTKETGAGTGMGLAAVYGTVKNHKGAISVTTTPGKGSCFILHLPLFSEDASLPVSIPTTSPATAAAHILLVEDEAIVREVAATMLESLGYTVSVCSNGREAVEIFRRQHDRIDLVIIDVVMPEMDGEETFDAMVAIDPDIRALVSSGYSLDGQAQSILNKGGAGFIQKPFRKGALAAKLEEILGK